MFGFDGFNTQTAGPTSIVGTWKAVDETVVNGQLQTQLAVVQFEPNGTFIEGYDLANNAATYLGRYSYEPNSHTLAFVIDSAAPSTGPQPNPFQQTSLTPVHSFGGQSAVELNNDLDFLFQSSSVAPSDFTLPAAPTSLSRFDNFFNNGSNRFDMFNGFNDGFNGFSDGSSFFGFNNHNFF